MKIIDGDRVKEITPEIVAKIFTGMSSDEQVRFFNHISYDEITRLRAELEKCREQITQYGEFYIVTNLETE